jgi:hypothetical protein
MNHRRQAAKDRASFQRAFADFFNETPEFTEQHLRFLEVRRDQFFLSLRAK